MKRSTSRNCSFIAAFMPLKRTTRPKSCTIFRPRSSLPQWLLASSRTNRSSKMGCFMGFDRNERRGAPGPGGKAAKSEIDPEELFELIDHVIQFLSRQARPDAQPEGLVHHDVGVRQVAA